MADQEKMTQKEYLLKHLNLLRDLKFIKSQLIMCVSNHTLLDSDLTIQWLRNNSNVIGEFEKKIFSLNYLLNYPSIIKSREIIKKYEIESLQIEFDIQKLRINYEIQNG